MTDRMTYLVQERDGTWRERDEKDTTWEATITDLFNGQFDQPHRVVEFNTAEGTSRDVSEDFARAIDRNAHFHGKQLSHGVRTFIHENAPDLMVADFNMQAAE